MSSIVGEKESELEAALSARASAGEGGEWVLVPRESTDSMHQAYTRAKYDGPKPTRIPDLWAAMLAAAPQPAQAGASGGGVPAEVAAWVAAKVEHRRLVAVYNARVEYARSQDFGAVSVDHEYQAMCRQQKVMDALVEPMFAALAAAPQPAQAGASGGVVPCPTCGAPTDRVERGAIESYGDTRHYEYTYRQATPASPATGQIDRADHAIALATIESLRTRLASCEAALEQRDAAYYATPPAHGDGEGDEDSILTAVLNEQPFTDRNDATRIWQMIDPVRDAREVLRAVIRVILTTRPTPKARDAVEVVQIPRSKSLDPITVYLTDLGNGAGRATVVCYNQAWTCFWGSMGCGLRDFIRSCDKHYVAGNMVSGRARVLRHELDYAERIAQAVIDALALPAQGRGDG